MEVRDSPASLVQTSAIVIGITGTGKSNFLNNLACLPKDRNNVPQIFRVFHNDGKYTKEHQAEKITINGQPITLIDVPGSNGTFTKRQIRMEYEKVIKSSSQIAKIFLVLRVGRPEYPDTLRLLFQLFGPTVLPYIHIIFTHIDMAVESLVNEQDISKNHGLVQQVVWSMYEELFNYLEKQGLPFQMTSYSCVFKDFSNKGSRFCDMASEIDHVRVLLWQACLPNADRYDVNAMCQDKYFISQSTFNTYTSMVQKLEFEARNIQKNVEERGKLWTWWSPSSWFFPNPSTGTVTFETYNSVFKLYFDLLFCLKSWEFIVDDLVRTDRLTFHNNPSAMDDMQGYVKKAAQLIENIVKACNLYVEKKDNLFICLGVRRCPNCGTSWGNLGGCSQRRCGVNADFNMNDFGKRKDGRIELMSLACGKEYTWESARPLYLNEVVGLLDFKDLVSIFGYESGDIWQLK